MPNFILTWDITVDREVTSPPEEEGGEPTVTVITDVQGCRADLGVAEDVAFLFAAALEADPTYSNVLLTGLDVTERGITGADAVESVSGVATAKKK